MNALFYLLLHLHVVQLEDMNMDDASEEVAVELAAQGVIGKRVDEMESGFMMALDYMIQLAEKDQDDKVPFQLSFGIFHFIFLSMQFPYNNPAKILFEYEVVHF